MQGILNWLIPLVFAVHGLGMIGGVWFVFSTPGWPTRWLPAGALTIIVQVLVGAIWVAAGIGFVLAGWGLWKSTDWWVVPAWIGSVGTLLGVGLWLNPKLPPGLYAGCALAVVVIVALVLGWTGTATG